MWSAVWFLAPHSHAAVVAQPQLCREEQKHPTPVLKRVNRTQQRFWRCIPWQEPLNNPNSAVIVRISEMV